MNLSFNSRLSLRSVYALYLFSIILTQLREMYFISISQFTHIVMKYLVGFQIFCNNWNVFFSFSLGKVVLTNQRWLRYNHEQAAYVKLILERLRESEEKRQKLRSEMEALKIQVSHQIEISEAITTKSPRIVKLQLLV